jgi:hypothetical protein
MSALSLGRDRMARAMAGRSAIAAVCILGLPDEGFLARFVG